MVDSFPHVVLIPTRNRPHLLRKLLDSIGQNISIFKYPQNQVSVIVIDDSTEPHLAEANWDFVNQVHDQWGFNITYWDKESQEKFLEAIRRYIPNIQPFVWDNRTKRRGFGGIRNLCLLIGLYQASSDNTLFTFLDDDVTLANLVSEMGKKKIKHVFSYFEKIDEVFSNQFTGPVAGSGKTKRGWVNFAGGGYTRDMYETPWIMAHLLWSLGYFFDIASRKSPNYPSTDIFRQVISGFKMGWTTVTYELEDLKTDISLERFLRILSASCSIMKDYGSYRLVPTIHNSKTPLFKEWNPYSTGGNITFRKASIESGCPYPVGGWRGEDITWAELMNFFVGGGAQISVPVGHFRTAAGKRKIEEEFAKDLIFDLHINIIRHLMGRATNIRSSVANTLGKRFNLDELGEGRDFPYTWYMRGAHADFHFDKWFGYIKSVKENMTRSAWFNDKKYSNDLKKINDFLNYIEDPKFVEKIKSHIPPADTLFEATKNFGYLIGKWPEVVEAVRQVKQYAAIGASKPPSDLISNIGRILGQPGQQEPHASGRTAGSLEDDIEDVEASIESLEEGLRELHNIKSKIDSIDNPEEKEDLIIRHDNLLREVDTLLKVVERRLGAA